MQPMKSLVGGICTNQGSYLEQVGWTKGIKGNTVSMHFRVGLKLSVHTILESAAWISQ